MDGRECGPGEVNMSVANQKQSSKGRGNIEGGKKCPSSEYIMVSRFVIRGRNSVSKRNPAENKNKRSTYNA